MAPSFSKCLLELPQLPVKMNTNAAKKRKKNKKKPSSASLLTKLTSPSQIALECSPKNPCFFPALPPGVSSPKIASVDLILSLNCGASIASANVFVKPTFQSRPQNQSLYHIATRVAALSYSRYTAESLRSQQDIQAPSSAASLKMRSSANPSHAFQKFIEGQSLVSLTRISTVTHGFSSQLIVEKSLLASSNSLSAKSYSIIAKSTPVYACNSKICTLAISIKACLNAKLLMRVPNAQVLDQYAMPSGPGLPIPIVSRPLERFILDMQPLIPSSSQTSAIQVMPKQPAALWLISPADEDEKEKEKEKEGVQEEEAFFLPKAPKLAARVISGIEVGGVTYKSNPTPAAKLDSSKPALSIFDEIRLLALELQHAPTLDTDRDEIRARQAVCNWLCMPQQQLQYQILGIVGFSEFGAVVAAIDHQNGLKVAIKLLYKQHAAEPLPMEIAALRDLNSKVRHPGIPLCLQAWEAQECFFLVTPYQEPCHQEHKAMPFLPLAYSVPGPLYNPYYMEHHVIPVVNGTSDLEVFVAMARGISWRSGGRGFLKRKLVQTLILDIAKVLEPIHGLGYCVGDIRARKVLVAGSSNPCGFEVALAANRQMRPTSVLRDQRRGLSACVPEGLVGANFITDGISADVYQLGLLACRLMTADDVLPQLAVDIDSKAITYGMLCRAPNFVMELPDLDREGRQLLCGMCDINPQSRLTIGDILSNSWLYGNI
ncbi:kinase-like domain-containing protein [Obelidium mucronatum]|nr:kinase-like domain-containing protein [Obelidium mucronatum]